MIVAPLALIGGTVLGSDLLGGSFFGTFALDLSQPLALAPALLFAVSNALAEELSYRGALRVWLTPGPRGRRAPTSARRSSSGWPTVAPTSWGRSPPWPRR